jgi:VanZ family protein
MKTAEPEGKCSLARILWYWGPVIVYAAAIFHFSSLSHPEEELPEILIKEVSDKALHLVEYGILGALCYRAFRWAAGPAVVKQALILAIGAASLYGFSDEVHQSFVPTREASLLDWVADTVGAAIGSAVVGIRAKRSFRAPCQGGLPGSLEE